MVEKLVRNIKREMASQGISGNKLAALVDRSTSTVNDLLNCKSIPGADLLFAIADVLGKSVDELRGKRAGKKSA